MGFKLMDQLKSKPPDKTKKWLCVRTFLSPLKKTFFMFLIATGVCLLCRPYMWGKLNFIDSHYDQMMWSCSSDRALSEDCLFVSASKASVKHLSLWPLSDRNPAPLVLHHDMKIHCLGVQWWNSSFLVLAREFLEWSWQGTSALCQLMRTMLFQRGTVSHL